jgi:hypothetical protein
LQVVAAIRYVTNGSYLKTIREFEQHTPAAEFESIMTRLKAMTDKFEAAEIRIKEFANQELQDLVGRRLYEMAADIIMSHLLLQDATRNSDLFRKSLNIYVNLAESEVEKHAQFISHISPDDIQNYRTTSQTEKAE